ncbi:hypothetical protein [Sphingosinithalassobacter portus]|uniref:hypothetical protein n=1 Tax=Stakelama portus TaxID=2676234 RepID=UPI000D6E28B8|nr:hypothetical protein [Sphingosinithalassobacter portus]
MRIAFLALAVAAAAISPAFAAAHPSGDDSTALIDACRAPESATRTVPGIAVADIPAAAGDLPGLLIRDATNQAEARLYYEPAFEQMARAHAPCWGAMLRDLAQVVPETRLGIRWASIVLTSDRDYVPPRDGTDARWTALVDGDEAHLEQFLFLVMPHEETHSVQTARRDGLPRWFEEGHAEWAALQVTALVRPEVAAAQRARHAAAATDADAHLGAWGSMRVSPEAIRRQLSPEDQQRFDKDPDFDPPGPFHFGPGDIVSDESNLETRYAAALALFDALEAAHGTSAVREWIAAVLADPEADPVALARTMLGEDLTPLLA